MPVKVIGHMTLEEEVVINNNFSSSYDMCDDHDEYLSIQQDVQYFESMLNKNIGTQFQDSYQEKLDKAYYKLNNF